MDKTIITNPLLIREIIVQILEPIIEKYTSQIENAINPPKELITINEAAQKLSVSPLTIRNRIRDGKIKAVKTGRRVLVVTESLHKSLRKI